MVGLFGIFSTAIVDASSALRAISVVDISISIVFFLNEHPLTVSSSPLITPNELSLFFRDVCAEIFVIIALSPFDNCVSFKSNPFYTSISTVR